MGGNMASQTSTLTVRGLATGRLGMHWKDIGRFLWQQVKVGALLALICAALAAGVTFFWHQGGNPQMVLLAVTISLFLSVQLASLTGTMIPILFNRFGIDPAVASGPLVTTTSDIISILLYFALTFSLLGMLPVG